MIQIIIIFTSIYSNFNFTIKHGMKYIGQCVVFDFLAALLVRHAEELNIDSWPDPKKIMFFQELQDMYHRFMKQRNSRKSESDNNLFLEIPMDIQAEDQLLSGFRSFSEEKKARLLAYMNMLENTKE